MYNASAYVQKLECAWKCMHLSATPLARVWLLYVFVSVCVLNITIATKVEALELVSVRVCLFYV